MHDERSRRGGIGSAHTGDDDRRVRPDGLGIRGRRHELGWSPRDLVNAIGRARTRETGVWETITPNLLRGIEEQNENVPYQTLCLVAAGLDCNPAELMAWDEASGAGGARETDR